MSQSNSRFNALDISVVNVNLVKINVGFGKPAIKRRCRSISVMAHLKKSIVEVKAVENY